jgi:excisionase family DNA binding protein|tara:strand:+ start:240 stop:470 length:231 start_codon:yes stop_codon:yes gene_type:complete
MTTHEFNGERIVGNGKMFISTKEIASMLGITRETVLTWIKAGKIPASRVGRTYIIKSKDFELFLERTRIPPTAPNF